MCNHCIDQKKIYDPDAVLAYLVTKDPCPLMGPTDLKNIGTYLCPKNFIVVKNKGGAIPTKCLKCKKWLNKEKIEQFDLFIPNRACIPVGAAIGMGSKCVFDLASFLVPLLS